MKKLEPHTDYAIYNRTVSAEDQENQWLSHIETLAAHIQKTYSVMMMNLKRDDMDEY